MSEPRLPDLTRSFERHLRAENKSDRTIETYLEAVRLLEAFLAGRGVRLAEADRAHIEAFLADLLARWKPATAANRYRSLKVFYAWLRRKVRSRSSTGCLTGSRVAWPPRGRTSRTPRTPRAPLGARGRARGPAGWPPQPPPGRPVAVRRSRGSVVAMAGWLAHRAAVPGGPGGGWSAAGGGVADCQGPHRPLSGCHVIQRERPQTLPGMSTPAPGRLLAAAGRSWARPGGPQAAVRPCVEHRFGPTQAPGVPVDGRTIHSRWLCPPRGEWSGQAEWMRFARLIQRPVRVLGRPSVCAAFGGI